MAKLRALKPRVAMLGSRVPVLVGQPGATPRQRGRAWMERRGAWLRLHPICVDCLVAGTITAERVEVDHEVPLWKGGGDDETNYATRCLTHHAAKSAREAAERALAGL